MSILRSPTKGKERALDNDLSSSQPPFGVYQSTPHTPPSRPLSISGSYSVVSSPVSNSPSKRSSGRGSMFIQASDILGSFKFGRRRKSIRSPVPPPRAPIILPEVIEIAPTADAEVEERDRIREEREEAAQALGLAGTTVVDSIHSLPNDAVSSIDAGSMSQDHDEGRELLDDFQEESELGIESIIEPRPRTADSKSTPNNGRIPHPYTSTLSVSIPPTPTSPTTSAIIHGRNRSGSMPAAPHSHNRSSSLIPTPVPPFPSTPSALSQFIQISSNLPKFYPSSSLRIFALTKQWKNRFMVLSTPVTTFSRNPNPSVSYLHLFKSSAAEDKELERLEINEDSVVFVADEEVGSRRHVIKVGGKDVGALKKEFNTEDGGRTMWFLQITDPSDSYRWITSIKNAIFAQRTMRAGLGHSNLSGSGIVEPRGDMDVMLSMRTQGIISSPTQGKLEGIDTKAIGINNVSSPQRSPTFSVSQDTSHSYAPSVASVRTQGTIPKPNNSPGSNAVLTLKGLFTGSNSVGRPRSSSRATSLSEGDTGAEDVGNQLMSRLGTSGSGTDSMGSSSLSDSSGTGGGNRNSLQTSSHTHLARALSLTSVSPLNNRHIITNHHGSIMSTISGLPRTNESMGVHPPRLDRKILASPIAIEPNSTSTSNEGFLSSPRSRETSDSQIPHHSSNRPMSAGSMSLFPPPRKRWTSSGTASLVYTDSPSTSFAQLAPDTHSEMGVLGMNINVQNASTSSIVDGQTGTPDHSLDQTDQEGNRNSSIFNPSFSFGTPPQRPTSACSRSVRSVSTIGSVHSTSNSPNPGAGGSSGVSGSSHNGHGSPGVDRSSIGTKRNSGRRWSRQLPQRLTPPSIPPPAIPTSNTNGNGNTSPKALRHPYSLEKRSSSPSQSSGVSDLHVPSNSKFSKRASASSAFSIKSTSTSHSFGSNSPRVGSATPTNRASMPPPPGPAPTFALPSAPVSTSTSTSVPVDKVKPRVIRPRSAGAGSGSGSTSVSFTPTSSPPSLSPKRSSFRESVTKTNKALRLSLSAPKPPPSSVLPPRPDEAPQHVRSKSQGHRRSYSGSSHQNGSLYSIPGSPSPPSPSPLLASPFPPPRGPLPPTPPAVAPHNNNETPPVIPPSSSRASSIKQRLRILSAPTSTNSNSNGSTHSSAFMNGYNLSGSSIRSSSTSHSSMIMSNGNGYNNNNNYISAPSTPIQNQYDLSFLSLATPATPSLPTPKIHTLTETEPEPVNLISLSPPPRRGSKRISVVDSHAEVGNGSLYEESVHGPIPDSPPPPKPLPDPLPDPLPSAASAVVPIADSLDHNNNNNNNKPHSRHGSVISLGIVSM